MEITPKLLKEYCKKDGLYSTPHLNDKLYLHYKGFREIRNLEGYTGLKVLWLEGNGLGQISGLEAQTEMRTLYLQENLIEKIENLGHMVSYGGEALRVNRHFYLWARSALNTPYSTFHPLHTHFHSPLPAWADVLEPE